MEMETPPKKEFQIGWICALPIEAAAAIHMLDENFGILQEQERSDTNTYTLGRIGRHHVVIACLPEGQYGTTSATTVANNMMRTFSDSLRISLMVGIGGGAPSAEHDIRLGDIVVSRPEGSHGGVIQYDVGKIGKDGKIQRVGSLNSPPKPLLNALAQMRAAELYDDPQYPLYIQEATEKNARTRKTFSRPNVKSDRLFKLEHGHLDNATSCDQCSVEWEEDRFAREDSDPHTHYGTIASGNTLIKDGKTREAIRKETGALCFEMEAAGLMTDFPCLVIRGICDYADSHKNIQWQGYAALAAAAFTKELLGYVSKDLSQQSPEEANLTSEEPTKIYPPSMTEKTATESSALSHDIWSSKDARETFNVSTKGTSMDPGDQEMDQDPGDNESIYTSDVPQSLAYIQELSKSFFKESELPDAKSLEKIREILPDLLRGFAQRIGGENHASVHFQVMKFINKKRVDIATSFEQYYLDTKTLQEKRQDDMSLDELFSRWQVDQVVDDPNSATARPDDVPFTNENAESDGNDDDDDDDVDDSQLAMYRNVVAKSIAFQWLLCRLHRETSLSTLEASSARAISTHIRQTLYARRENRVVSSQRGPPKCSVLFQSDWVPLAFVSNQEYKEEPDDAIERAIVIVQAVKGDAEAMPCSEYVGRTWPLFGEHFMGLVKHTVQSKPGLRCSVGLFDKTKLTAWLEPSGCFALEATGVVETLVEVGEVFAFITTALRSAPGDSVASVIPTINSSGKTKDQNYRFTFHAQHSDDILRSIGQCWQNLFRNPVVVLGFPVQRRRPDQGPGLDISLVTLAALVGTRRLAIFCGKIFLQGFCTILVPTRYAGDTVHWHVLFNEDGNRIPFTDSRVREIIKDFDLSKHLTLSGIETARQIVGWCPHVRNYAGSKEASYDIYKTGLRQPDSRFAFDRVSISAGKIVSASVSVAIGKKDKPARAAKTTDYHKQIEWAEEQFIVFYDCQDRRAWLIDGLSALLHLVRARLAHRRKVGREVLFRDDDIREPETSHTGKAAANAILRDRANMDLKIYEKWNRIVEETSQKGNEQLETNLKTQKTWEQLPDLVGDVYTILGMLFDIQTDKSTEDGYGARVHKSPRRHLEGWDFQQVTAGVDLLPKAAVLHDIGLGWVDLVRAINAVTLFGVGYGEIIQPVDTAQALSIGGEGAANSAQPGPAANAPQGGIRCDRWNTLPKGEDLLATTIPVIRDIMENIYKDPNSKERLRELFTGIYWHSPDKVFESCNCGTVPGGTQCDRVQVLLPTRFPRLFARNFHSPPEPLPDHGAVIFGHSVKFPLIWKWEAYSVPTEGNPRLPQLTSQSSHQSDSGLAMSVTSSTANEQSIGRGSILQQASSRSTVAEAPSRLDLASVAGSDTTTSSGKGKRADNLFKRLLKKTRLSTKSREGSERSK